MKREIRIGVTAICTVLLVALFYHHSVGLNFSILCLSTWGILHYYTPKSRKDKIYWLLSLTVFLTIISQAWYGDVYSFMALFISLSVLGLYAQFTRLNFVLYPIVRGINFFIFPFRFFLFRWIPKNKKDRKFLKKFMFLFVIPLFMAILFLVVYSTGSDLFQEFFKNIHIDAEMIGLTLLGWFFFFNFWMTYIPKYIAKMNQLTRDQFGEESKSKFSSLLKTKELSFRRDSGKITLILLNIILIIFILTYNYEQFFTPKETGNLSVETHARINTIIFSIVMAIGIILFYFKSVFNFDEKANQLRKLTYLWIILNGLLVLSAGIKISEYVFTLGITYKRIGVYIFLVLCIIGLLFAFKKIRDKKTNIYLISRMSWSFFITFIFCSLINFSWVVTKFNLTFCKDIDVYYLQSLDYNQELLYNQFKDNREWHPYFERQRYIQQIEKNKEVLSSHLYYSFLNIGVQK